MKNISRNNFKCCEKKRFNFNEKKNNTIKSLHDIEYFLNNIQKIKKSIDFCKIIKK